MISICCGNIHQPKWIGGIFSEYSWGNSLINYKLWKVRFKGNTIGYTKNKIMTQLCAATSATATLPPKQIWFFGDSAPRMKIIRLQCFSIKISKWKWIKDCHAQSHSILHLFSSLAGWKAPNKKRIWIRCYIFMSWKNTLNITEPSNLPRYSHDYNHLTKPRLNDKHHWYWNPYVFFWVMSLAKRGSPTPGKTFTTVDPIRPELRHHDGCHGHRLVVKLASRQLRPAAWPSQWTAAPVKNVSTPMKTKHTTSIKFVTSMSYVKKVWYDVCIYLKKLVFC